ncbi:MAG: isochorismatase family protein [Patescibacteria group bacterium]|nr:isochorismatase family protein [Patescibacteria group bacterium]MDE2437943.1 isochorismatase family protein [Patescibacteria group bacterium]
MRSTALVLVDLQNDFFPGGALGVSRAHEIIDPVNTMIAWAVTMNLQIYVSRDWHQPETPHFKKWPVHCVQGTEGAKFHPEVHIPTEYPRLVIISKGLGNADGYSAFESDMSPGVLRLLVCGLATDYCVLSTVRDACERGYEVVLLSDACRAVNQHPGDGDRALQEMRNRGAHVMSTGEFLRSLDEEE